MLSFLRLGLYNRRFYSFIEEHFEIQRSGDLISSPRHGGIIYFSRAQFNIPQWLSGLTFSSVVFVS